MKKLTNKQIEQVREALALFDNQGALDRLRVQSSDAGQWDSLISHHLTAFTGIEVSPGTVRHWRSDVGCKWFADVESVDVELFEPKAKQALLLVSSEDLGRLVDQAVEQALNITRQPEATIEPQDIENPEPVGTEAEPELEPKTKETVYSGCMVA